MLNDSDHAERRLVWLTVNCSYSHSSLALPLIHSACREVSGWRWERVEVTREEDPAAIAAQIVSVPCDLLCATLYLFNREAVFHILKRVHALSPQTHIAVGGPECPACDAAEILAENPFISTVFSGEGEGTFSDFLREFPQKKDLRRAIPEGENASFNAWPDSPLPVDDEFFRTDKPFVQIETSRGCPMACAYCTSSGVPARTRDLALVEQELAKLRAKGVREIRVLDRTFNLPQNRGAALLRMFQRFPDIHFHLEIHPQFLGRELRECLRSALPDQLHIEAGIQSLDPAVQRAIGRRSDPALALDGLTFLTSCAAFETHTDLLAGLPEQTLDSLKNDIVQLMLAVPAEIQLEVLKILPGTPIKNELGRYGICYAPDPPYDVMRTSAMSTDDILYARRLSRLLDLFYNHRALHPVMLAASKELPEFFLRFAEAIHAQNKATDSLLDLKKRFLCLADFLQKHPLHSASDELAFCWLMAGYPPGEGAASSAKIAKSLPAEAELLSGTAECAAHRETKFYMLEQPRRTLYFAYNRNFSFNKPCAVWQVAFP